jgi:hypothetical protein
VRRFIDTSVDYLLWPILFGGAVALMAYGTSLGHGTLAFNLTYPDEVSPRILTFSVRGCGRSVRSGVSPADSQVRHS